MIDGVIFDIDGTILDSMSIWDRAAEMFLNNLGIEAEDGLGETMFSMSMIDGASFLKQRYSLDMDKDAIIGGINHTIEDFYHEQVQLKEGVEGFLKEMKQRGIKIVAATSSDRHIVVGALKRLNLMGYFEKIFTCTEIGAGKEKPDIYLAAAQYMGTRPRNTWVFEDALYAIQTAKNAGFRTVGVFDASSIIDLEKIRQVSDIYLDKLDTLSVFLKQVCNYSKMEGENENSINDCRK
ncbi:MAG: HAD family phosphatase [Clostridiaceae bacterium]|nr:HAD family phosphatase [Clostridiaceae bacterium]